MFFLPRYKIPNPYGQVLSWIVDRGFSKRLKNNNNFDCSAGQSTQSEYMANPIGTLAPNGRISAHA
jgi:hypothetical protein